MSEGTGLTPPVDASAVAGSLLVLSNYYYPEPTGSAPPITDLSLWLGENGLNPDVLAARPSYPRNAVYEGYEAGQRDREVMGGANVRRVASFVAKSRGVVGRLLSETSFALSAVLARPRRYRGVICVCPSVFVVLVAPFFVEKGGRLVAIIHDIQSGLASNLKFGMGGVLTVALRGLEAWSLNRCDSLIALSPAMAEELRGIGVRAPIEVIPPQVNVREIRPVPHEADERALLVYSGNLGRKQGLDQVLELAAVLNRRNAEIDILIRGEGSERASLEDQVRREGLTNVRFADLAPRAEISEALGAATLHLVPQAPGGANFALPSKIFSIMAAERAYVATASVGTPLAMVTEAANAGVCVEPHDAEAFADAIERLVADPEARATLARSGRHYAETTVDREVVCRNILAAVVKPGAGT
jgi:colanic acid biosynthesis glycosyl transferase WcaI